VPEIAETDLQTFPLDHHGLIAAVCKDLRIAERIDALLPVHDARVVSPGRSVVALILNGLGFTNRRLYLTPQFFPASPSNAFWMRPFQRRISMTIRSDMPLMTFPTTASADSSAP
jgi:hypothetical protein